MTPELDTKPMALGVSLYLSDKKPTNLSRSVQVLAAWTGADDNTNAPRAAAQAYLTNEPILVSPLAWVTGLKRSHTRSGWALAYRCCLVWRASWAESRRLVPYEP